MTLDELKTLVKGYLEEDEQSFNDNLDFMIGQAEINIARRLALPTSDGEIVDSMAVNDWTIDVPSDFLSVNSLWVGDSLSFGNVLLQKDKSFFREAYGVDAQGAPVQSGHPEYYFYEDGDTITFGPKADSPYQYVLDYTKQHESIVANPTGTWLSTNGPDALTYATVMEGYVYLKGDADIMSLYAQRYEAAMRNLQSVVGRLRIRDENVGGVSYDAEFSDRRKKGS